MSVNFSVYIGPFAKCVRGKDTPTWGDIDVAIGSDLFCCNMEDGEDRLFDYWLPNKSDGQLGIQWDKNGGDEHAAVLPDAALMDRERSRFEGYYGLAVSNLVATYKHKPGLHRVEIVWGIVPYFM